jgi:hypothetical protein
MSRVYRLTFRCTGPGAASSVRFQWPRHWRLLPASELCVRHKELAAMYIPAHWTCVGYLLMAYGHRHLFSSGWRMKRKERLLPCFLMESLATRNIQSSLRPRACLQTVCHREARSACRGDPASLRRSGGSARSGTSRAAAGSAKAGWIASSSRRSGPPRNDGLKTCPWMP